ncbi:MAG: L-threonylcarbamoyladenylate synthase [Pseudomonadota bacterium]
MTHEDHATKLLSGPEGRAEAAALLRGGALVALPTETVYGLGADATNARAVAAIFAAKRRPRFNPLIVHVASFAQVQELAEVPDWAATLAEAFWPGALTLVLPSRGVLPDLVTAGLPSVAVRMPSHPLAVALLRDVGRPVAAPSANPSGRVSATTAAHVMDGLGGRIAAVLDGGPTAVGLESTIVGGAGPALLRPGGIAVEDIERVLSRPLAAARDGSAPTAPGQLRSHYAPAAAVRLNALEARAGELLLGFGPVAGDLSLSPRGDLVEAAAQLFSALRALDGRGQPIAVAPIPEEGLGRAINDRLRRAAAPRDS